MQTHPYYRKPPSQRQLRVGRTIQETIASAMLRDCKLHGIFNHITITGASVSTDLKNATIFFSNSYILRQKIADPLQLEKQMNSIKGYFRNIIAKNLYLKFTPNISFSYDKKTEGVDSMNQLLNNLVPQED